MGKASCCRRHVSGAVKAGASTGNEGEVAILERVFSSTGEWKGDDGGKEARSVLLD